MARLHIALEETKNKRGAGPGGTASGTLEMIKQMELVYEGIQASAIRLVRKQRDKEYIRILEKTAV